MVIATDRKQARVIFRHIRSMLTGVEMLKRMVERESAESFDLVNSITIEVATANFRTVRGYTCVAALCDEIAHWPTDDSASPDSEVLAAIAPSMLTIPNAMLLCASTPYAKKGTLYDAHKNHYGKDGDILIWRAPTIRMNPTVPQSAIDAELAKDRAKNTAEYLAVFRDDIAGFVQREIVEACVDVGVRERPPQLGKHKYFTFSDPAGGSGGDSMTACVGHREGDLTVVDALREHFSPFDPESVVDDHAKLFKAYGVRETYGDAYACQWVASAYEKRGIRYNHVGAPRSSLYLNLLPKLNSKTVKLLNNSRAVNQICNLERRTVRGGNDRVDHPDHGHDDLSNVIAGICFALENVKPNPPMRQFTWDMREVIWDDIQKRHIILETDDAPSKWDGPDIIPGGYASKRR